MGKALVHELAAQYPSAQIHALSRKAQTGFASNVICNMIDYECETSISMAVELAARDAPLDMVVVTTGILHGDSFGPEKALKDISAHNLVKLVTANTIVPALIAKHFLPHLSRENRSIFAALSARVGSISDNQLGGWYSYRASKSALNMIIKTAAIEMARRNPKAIVVGLHPGTVASPLSEPFQRNVAQRELFTAAYSASQLVRVLEGLEPFQSGKCFAWDGREIEP